MTMATMTNVTRAALGRVAKIGALYDIRTDSFLNDTLFASDPRNDAVNITDLGDSSIELVMTDTIQDKFSKFGIEGELQVSLLAGMVKLAGSGAYLAEERKSARAQSMSCIYKQRTVNEYFSVRQNKEKIDMDIISHKSPNKATHVVVGIDWGAVCTITCDYENVENEDASELKGEMSAEIEKLKHLTNTKGSKKVEYDGKNKERGRKFSFRCKVDVSAPDKVLPVTFEDAVEFARNLPELIKNKNNGKGVPLTYHLMPLDAIFKMCNSEIKLDSHYRHINEGTIQKCGDLLEWVTKKRQVLYDLHSDIHASGAFIPDHCINNIDAIWREMGVRQAHLKSELQELIRRVRSGSKEVSDLNKFLEEQKPELLFNSKHEHEIDECKVALNKVLLIKTQKSKRIIYIGKNEQLFTHEKRNVFVLYKPKDVMVREDLERNQKLFTHLHTLYGQEDTSAFYVCDQSITPKQWPAKLQYASIHKYVSGNLVCTDLYAKEGKYMEMCLIKIGKPKAYRTIPSNRTNVELPCPIAEPGSGQCIGNPVTWSCSICKELVEYGIDTKCFYCKCGESIPVDATFCCNDVNHDMSFVQYPKDILITKLLQHRAMKEMNILIMGETGVGKSSWINGFQQYLYYRNLKEALSSNEWPVLIPSTFTIFPDGKEMKVEIGEPDPNELQETGMSATKEPQAYVFFLDDTRVRFIDTPGIGTTGGIEEDHKNVDKILTYISNYDEIHAVCILLTPNNSRLTATFRFCIQELLSQLHSSAKENIVFCFTHTRGTFYHPGDTLPSLKKELRERNVGIEATPHNIFCFDSESFRFLACKRKNINTFDAHEADYVGSWNKSVEETRRLFHHFQNNLKPFRVRDTLSMNEARRIIVAMSKPLAEVAKTIEHNVLDAEEAKLQIELSENSIRSLKEIFEFTGYDLEEFQLDSPRTVCTHDECVKFVRVGTNKVENVVYSQVCHDNCTCTLFPTGLLDKLRLRFCKCMNMVTGICSECGHKYSLHMQLTYETRIVQKEFLSEQVKDKIRALDDEKAMHETVIQEIDTKIKEIKDEERRILQIGAKYGSFLKANALIPYNDAVKGYLDMCIDHEKGKATKNRNHAFLERMQILKQEYERQVEIIDTPSDTSDVEMIHSPAQVKQLQSELFQLTYFGPTLKKLFDGISIINSARNRSFREKIGRCRQNLVGKIKGIFKGPS